MKWQRLSIIVRLVCGLFALGSIVVVYFGCWVISRHGFNQMSIVLLLSGVFGVGAFGFAAVMGRFPDIPEQPTDARREEKQ